MVIKQLFLRKKMSWEEIGTCGVVGYIWTSVDTRIVEDWRQSIVPIPKDKLEELRHAAFDDDGSKDKSNKPTLPDKDEKEIKRIAEPNPLILLSFAQLPSND